jgi:hypothetical protein
VIDMTRLTDVYANQGLDRPKTEEDWSTYSKRKQDRRKRNVVAAREVLDRNQIRYQEKEHGLFYLTLETIRFIEYYPATGDWKVYIPGDSGGDDVHSSPILLNSGFGVRNLVKYIKGEVI